MKSDLPERTFAFAVEVVNLCRYLDEKPGVSRTLANQFSAYPISDMGKEIKNPL